MPTKSLKLGFSFASSLRRSFRVRLFAGITAVILVVSAAFASLLFYHQYRDQLDKKQSEGNLMARLLARDVRLAVFSGERDEIIKSAKGTMAMPDVQAVEIYDKEGALISRLAIEMEEHAHYSSFVAEIPGLINKNFEKSLIVSKHWGENAEASVGTVRITLDDSRAEARQHKLILTAVMTTLCLLALGVFAAFLLARSMTRPIAQLAACAAALKDGDDSVYVPVETDDEIGHLATTFNSMVTAIRSRTKDLEEALEELYQMNIALEGKVERRTAQLAGANRELEAFNYSASHDLRAPLNRLAGFCDALREDYGERLDEQGRQYLDRIAATGQQMDRVLSAMLTLYQVQQRAMAPRNLDISELVHAVTAALHQREPERDVEFVIQDDVIVYGDMKLLWLALENIIGNAWKFTLGKAPGRIEFYVKTVDGEKICCLKDNGAGFDMAYYDKLFTPFQRLHNFEDFPGTGVGLAIVQRIISRHDGRIWLESMEGVGTTCCFVLPQGPDHEENPAKEGA